VNQKMNRVAAAALFSACAERVPSRGSGGPGVMAFQRAASSRQFKFPEAN
jgi:hypothetical protein